MLSALASETQHYRKGASIGSGPEEIVSEFWQQWLEHREELYGCCLRMMNFNATDAEDALSGAMLKAWEKVQQHVGKIADFRPWLKGLTTNLCIDIIRKRSRDAARVESIELASAREELGTATSVETPELVLKREEKTTEILRAIADLPSRLRSTFILHFDEELNHREIAQIQGISYDNVCKRISQARKILKEKLSGYFLESEGVSAVKASVRPSSLSTPPSQEKQKRHQADVPKAKETAECRGGAVEEKPHLAKVSAEPKDVEGEKIEEQPQEPREPVRWQTSTSGEKLTQTKIAGATLPSRPRETKIEVLQRSMNRELPARSASMFLAWKNLQTMKCQGSQGFGSPKGKSLWDRAMTAKTYSCEAPRGEQYFWVGSQTSSAPEYWARGCYASKLRYVQVSTEEQRFGAQVQKMLFLKLPLCRGHRKVAPGKLHRNRSG